MKTAQQLGIGDWDMGDSGVSPDDIANASGEEGCVACGIASLGIWEGFEQIRHTCPARQGQRIE